MLSQQTIHEWTWVASEKKSASEKPLTLSGIIQTSPPQTNDEN